jgi:hypothetical protein
MSARLDAAFRGQRLKLAGIVQGATVRAWMRERHNRDAAIEAALQVVHAGQARTVELVDAYMALKVGGDPKGLPAGRFTVEALRGLPAAEVYDRPYGALGAQLAGGAEFSTALSSAQASVSKLAGTDLQLAQTHAAREWMADDDRVFGYRRVLGGSHNCPLCSAASTRIYYRADLMPIHENCHCTVAPLIGEHPGGLSVPDEAVRVTNDPEIGPRLLADGWAA